MTSALTLKNLAKSYGHFQALKPTNLEIPQGAFTSILGPSGSGKTTTLMLLAGIEVATGGEIWYGNENITHVEVERRHVGIVFQNYALFPNLTVRENILYGIKDKQLANKRLTEMLTLTHLQGLENRYPSELSGGQQQRVALARALAPHPHFLLLDEPLSALDAWSRSQIGEELREIQQKSGVTTIMVTHDRREALSLSDFVIVMNNGSIEQAGTPREIYDQPKTKFVATFVGGMNVINHPRIANGRTVGIRYSDVEVMHADERSISKDYHFVGKLLSHEFFGDIIRAKFLLNDCKTQVTADIPSLQAISQNVCDGEYYVLHLMPNKWRQWEEK